MENKEFFEGIEHSLNQIREDAYKEGYAAGNKDKAFDPYGVENINFSLDLKEDDERKEIFKKQRLERGFDETELWNLDTTILKFILPRLKAFKENTFGHPGDFKDMDDWLDCIDKMIKSIEDIINDESGADYEGLELFKKHFFDLWW